MIDASGKVLNSYQYDAFGNTMSYAETVANRFRYAGEQFDTITGQYYLRARYYDPQVGRFTQEDTYRGDGLNLYAYVANNPVKYVDPSGHCKDEIIAAVDEHILYNPNISEAAKKQLRKIIGKGTGNTDIQRMMDNVKNDTSLGLTDIKKQTIIGIGRAMLEEGY